MAQDTGSGIIGRHIDVYRLPPPTVDEGRFLEHQRVLVVPPAPSAGALRRQTDDRQRHRRQRQRRYGRLTVVCAGGRSGRA